MVLIYHVIKNMDENKKSKMYRIANNIRKDIIQMVYTAGSGHPGGSLSITDIITYLYFEKMRINTSDLKDPNRDRLVLSKGHSAIALYAALKELEIISEEDIKKFRQVNGILQGHPDMKHIPGIDMTTGSLGQGISSAVGMAIAGKIDNRDYRVYTILGDGEIQEGQVWEAAMSASHYKLDNLVVVVDNNNLQIDGTIDSVMNPYPIDEKFKAFGFHVIKINGHDFDEIENAFSEAEKCKEKPTLILAKTVKGKGISFMENQVGWHGKAPNTEQYEQAIRELNQNII